MLTEVSTLPDKVWCLYVSIRLQQLINFTNHMSQGKSAVIDWYWIITTSDIKTQLPYSTELLKQSGLMFEGGSSDEVAL